MKQYYDLVLKIVQEGIDKEDRTGVGTKSIFGHQMRFDIQYGFPLLTTKHTNFKAILVELLWFLQGGTNVDFLHQHNVHIWDEWADENGNLGPVYGKQWRSWPAFKLKQEDGIDVAQAQTVDQIANVVKSLRENPFSRRHIVTAWNPAEVEDMALPPCHTLFQFNVRPDGEPGNNAPAYLDCQLYQRSADVFLGLPFNIASYALLTTMIAHVTNLTPGEFVHTLGDAHLYKNHYAQVTELLGRKPEILPRPRIRFQGQESIKEIDDFNVNNVILDGYHPLPPIKAPIAV